MIYRAPMRGTADAAVSAGVVGMADGPTERDARRVARFADLPDGTYVWTRTEDGAYRLGRVRGAYRYDAASVPGLAHLRPARWLARAFAEDEVPAAVAATFARGGRNLQRTHDAAAERATAALWEEYGGG